MAMRGSESTPSHRTRLPSPAFSPEPWVFPQGRAAQVPRPLSRPGAGFASQRFQSHSPIRSPGARMREHFCRYFRGCSQSILHRHLKATTVCSTLQLRGCPRLCVPIVLPRQETNRRPAPITPTMATPPRLSGVSRRPGFLFPQKFTPNPFPFSRLPLQCNRGDSDCSVESGPVHPPAGVPCPPARTHRGLRRRTPLRSQGVESQFDADCLLRLADEAL